VRERDLVEGATVWPLVKVALPQFWPLESLAYFFASVHHACLRGLNLGIDGVGHFFLTRMYRLRVIVAAVELRMRCVVVHAPPPSVTFTMVVTLVKTASEISARDVVADLRVCRCCLLELRWYFDSLFWKYCFLIGRGRVGRQSSRS